MSESDEVLRHILSLSMEETSGRQGPPPASQTSLREDVVDVVLSSKHVLKHKSCSVCGDEYKIGDDGKMLPCKHIYHDDCILSWLAMVRILLFYSSYLHFSPQFFLK